MVRGRCLTRQFKPPFHFSTLPRKWRPSTPQEPEPAIEFVTVTGLALSQTVDGVDFDVAILGTVGDSLLITKNRKQAKNGDVRRVVELDGDQILLGNGKKQNASPALHVRQGHTVTSQVSQSKERGKMFALALSSGIAQISTTQGLVSVSRAQAESRIYTDSVEAFEQAVRQETGWHVWQRYAF